MKRTPPVRSKTPWPVHWLMLYGNDDFVANGTVLDIRPGQWHAEGPMPVQPGMRLNIWAWPPEKPEGLHIGEASVLWVKGYEFGLDVQDLNPVDHEWLTQFLDQACGLWLVPRLRSVVRTTTNGMQGGASEWRSAGPVADESGPDVFRKRVFPFLGAVRQRVA